MKVLPTVVCVVVLAAMAASAAADGPNKHQVMLRCGAGLHSDKYCAVQQQRKVIPAMAQAVKHRFAVNGIILKRGYKLSWNQSKLNREQRYWLRMDSKSKHIPIASKRFKRWNSWICIHQHEGAWNDRGDPYWGGLQMDRSFMNAYGAEFIRIYHGYADKWPPLIQIVVAERAYESRGFEPWPNTGRACGVR